jgi:hypothetical protein
MLRWARLPVRSTRALANVTYFYNRDVKDAVDRAEDAGAALTLVLGGISLSSSGPCSARYMIFLGS